MHKQGSFPIQKIKIDHNHKKHDTFSKLNLKFESYIENWISPKFLIGCLYIVDTVYYDYLNSNISLNVLFISCVIPLHFLHRILRYLFQG